MKNYIRSGIFILTSHLLGLSIMFSAASAQDFIKSLGTHAKDRSPKKQSDVPGPGTKTDLSCNGKPRTGILSDVPTADELNNATFFPFGLANRRLILSLLGGRPYTYVTSNTKLLDQDLEGYNFVVKDKESPVLPLGVWAGSMSDGKVIYSLKKVLNHQVTGEEKGFRVRSGFELPLEMEGVFPDGRIITKKLTLKSGSDVMDLDVEVKGDKGCSAPVELELVQADKRSSGKSPVSRWTVFVQDEKGELITIDPVKLSPEKPQTITGKWIAIADRIRAYILVPDNAPSVITVGAENGLLYGRIAGNTTKASARVYFGPKDLQAISKFDPSINFSSSAKSTPRPENIVAEAPVEAKSGLMTWLIAGAALLFVVLIIKFSARSKSD